MAPRLTAPVWRLAASSRRSRGMAFSLAAHPVAVVAAAVAVAAAPVEVEVTRRAKPGGGAGLLQQVFGGHGLQRRFLLARGPGDGPVLPLQYRTEYRRQSVRYGGAAKKKGCRSAAAPFSSL